MRELKFRAWIKERIWNENVPKMFKREDGYPKMVDVMCVYSGDYFEYREGLCYLKVTRQTYDFELMQWTGLRDKEGTEIYEGDIVAGEPPRYISPVKGVVKYGALAFAFVGKTESGKKWFDTITNPRITVAKDIEVIGNIFENPELLEGE